MWALIGGNASGMRDWRHARPGQARRLKCKCSKEPGSKKEARGTDKVDEVRGSASWLESMRTAVSLRSWSALISLPLTVQEILVFDEDSSSAPLIN